MCDLETVGVPSTFNIIRSAESLTRMFPSLDLEEIFVTYFHIFPSTYLDCVTKIFFQFITSDTEKTRRGGGKVSLLFIYYEQQVKRELKRIHISGYRCNERLKAKTD